MKIRQACGIDYGEARAVRAGIRNNNDLIWVGRAPSFAAKLSDEREFPYCTFISKKPHDVLMEKAKRPNDLEIWEERSVKFAGNTETIYRSKYTKKP